MEEKTIDQCGILNLDYVLVFYQQKNNKTAFYLQKHYIEIYPNMN